jgi:hypothetical protein
MHKDKKDQERRKSKERPNSLREGGPQTQSEEGDPETLPKKTVTLVDAESDKPPGPKNEQTVERPRGCKAGCANRCVEKNRTGGEHKSKIQERDVGTSECGP